MGFMGKAINLVGQKFGRLTVISKNEEVSKQKKSLHWNCKCDCGNEKIVDGRNLRGGKTTSCGCLNKELSSQRMRKMINEKWEDEEYRQNRSRKVSEQMKELWKNEEYRHMKSSELKARWQDEEYRKYMTNMSKELWQDEDFKQETVKKISKAWEDEERREKQKNKLTEIWSSEELRSRQRDKQNELWDNNEARRKEYSERFSGENSPAYNPNLTDEDRQDRRNLPGYEEWKQRVKEQANYTCDCCGQHGGKLVSHHKDGYNWCKERRIDITNGVCLCEECHKKFHKQYGKGNNTEIQYIDFKEKLQKNSIL